MDNNSPMGDDPLHSQLFTQTQWLSNQAVVNASTDGTSEDFSIPISAFCQQAMSQVNATSEEEESSNSCGSFGSSNSHDIAPDNTINPQLSAPLRKFVIQPSLMQDSPSVVRRQRTRKKIYPKMRPYNQVLADVVFVLSGFINPKRRKLKDLALSMGATYQAKWSSRCTHLICSFKDTYKFQQAKATKGKIVKDRWIIECSRQKMFVNWRDYQLTQHNYPESEEDVFDDMDFALQTGYGSSTTAATTN